MNNIIKSCLVLFVVSSVCVAALAYVHEITMKPIMLAEIEAENEANVKIFPDADEFKKGEASFTPGGMITEITTAYKNGEKFGYAVKTSPKGYGGTINMVAGFNHDGSISGIAVLSHSETAGLGAHCEDEWFADKFKDKSSFPLEVVKMDPSENEIDAITSATITTQHVVDAVNDAHEWFITEGGGAW